MAKEILKKRKLTCTNCGKEKPPTTGFYLSQSKLYKFNDGRMTICKDCLFEKYDELSVKYGDENKALYHLCMMFDIYFSNDLVLSSYSQSKRSNDKKGLLQTYITKLNSLPQYKGMCSFQSDYVILDEKVIIELEDKYKVEKEYNMEKLVKKEKKITEEIRRRWWREYSDEECLLLEEYYEYYYDNYDHEKDLAKLDSLKEVCTFKLIIAQAKKDRDNKTVREFSSLISQKLTDGNLKPSQRKAYGDQAGEGIGTDIRALIENKMPVNEVLPQFRDVDNFTKMIEDTFLNPFKKVNGIFSKSDKGDKDDN